MTENKGEWWEKPNDCKLCTSMYVQKVIVLYFRQGKSTLCSLLGIALRRDLIVNMSDISCIPQTTML